MSRRTPPQAATDDRAFPVRILFSVPEIGFGRRLPEFLTWLTLEVGRGNYATHGFARDGAGDRMALYLRHPRDAVRLMDAFPDFALADSTLLPGYYSPDAPLVTLTEEGQAVCNLYDQQTEQAALGALFKNTRWTDRVGNLQPGHVYPDQLAPIVRHDTVHGGFELVKARWGMPSPAFALKTERDPGVTNVRNLASPHWRRWLGPAHRCLVPVSAFAEPRPERGAGNQWFTTADGRPMFFAGIEVRGWKSVRKVRDGETVDDLFAFLTCPANAEVSAVHPKAMPVILTEPQEWERWMAEPFDLAKELQRPLGDGVLHNL